MMRPVLSRAASIRVKASQTSLPSLAWREYGSCLGSWMKRCLSDSKLLQSAATWHVQTQELTLPGKATASQSLLRYLACTSRDKLPWAKALAREEE